MQLVKKTAAGALEEIRKLIHERPYAKEPIREFMENLKRVLETGINPITEAILDETQDLVHHESKGKKRFAHEVLLTYAVSRLERILGETHKKKDIEKMHAFLVALIAEIGEHRKALAKK
jgi:hypothetical protein